MRKERRCVPNLAGHFDGPIGVDEGLAAPLNEGARGHVRTEARGVCPGASVRLALREGFPGVAGGLFAGFQQFVSPESFTLLQSITILGMVILGGMGSIRGAILGAALVTLLWRRP